MFRGYKTLTCVLAFVISACGSGATTIDRNNPERVMRGRAVYQTHCAGCHGANLEGQPEWRVRRPDGRLPAPPHDESGHTWHHPNSMLIEIVRDGLVPPNAPEGYETDMPAFGKTLGAEDIAAVLSFIQSRWTPDVFKFRDENKLDAL